MSQPITCKCKTVLGYYDPVTGYIAGTTIFGVVLVCERAGCGFRLRWDGQKFVKKNRSRPVLAAATAY